MSRRSPRSPDLVSVKSSVETVGFRWRRFTVAFHKRSKLLSVHLTLLRKSIAGVVDVGLRRVALTHLAKSLCEMELRLVQVPQVVGQVHDRTPLPRSRPPLLPPRPRSQASFRSSLVLMLSWWEPARARRPSLRSS